MCGRAYFTYTDAELEARYLTQKQHRHPLGELKPIYNLCPTEQAPVILVKNGHRTIELLRWGLVPAWAKSIQEASKYNLINARGEEIAVKQSFKEAFRQRRCLVPLSGFYEWHRIDPKTKTPFSISLTDGNIMSAAGIWESWHSRETGEIVESFSIITIGSNSFMSKIHDRMPVIINPSDEDDWLNPEIKDIKTLQNFLRPCPSEWLKAYEVSTKVNSPKNKDIDLLQPVYISK